MLKLQPLEQSQIGNRHVLARSCRNASPLPRLLCVLLVSQARAWCCARDAVPQCPVSLGAPTAPRGGYNYQPHFMETEAREVRSLARGHTEEAGWRWGSNLGLSSSEGLVETIHLMHLSAKSRCSFALTPQI